MRRLKKFLTYTLRRLKISRLSRKERQGYVADKVREYLHLIEVIHHTYDKGVSLADGHPGLLLILDVLREKILIWLETKETAYDLITESELRYNLSTLLRIVGNYELNNPAAIDAVKELGAVLGLNPWPAMSMAQSDFLIIYSGYGTPGSRLTRDKRFQKYHNTIFVDDPSVDVTELAATLRSLGLSNKEIVQSSPPCH